MKADVSRRTFDPAKHYAAVLHEQGRMLTDADLDEQQGILAHRIEREAADLIGGCGGPIGDAGFAITAQGGALQIGAGRYYVDGILVHNPEATSLSDQPDRPDVVWPPEGGAGRYQVYLDVWRRLVTALDDPSIRDVALGGPTTSARTRTVWQVRVAGAGDGDTCRSALPDPGGTTGRLAARADPETSGVDPCEVPPSAGFKGLENQLYRVEVLDGGEAYDLGAAPDVVAITGFPAGTTEQLTVADVEGLSVGDAVEIFRAAAGHDPLAAQLAHVSDITDTTLTLDSDLASFSLDEAPRLRRVGATFLWSRENGSVVTAIERLEGAELTVADLGPDDVRGFATGQWVEITDDRDELEMRPGQLRRIEAIDEARRVVVLKTPAEPLAAPPDGVDPAWHPKLRRWDGAGAVRHGNAAPGTDWIPLEDGVQVRFSAGRYRTGDYWHFPARTATADPASGNIEWPQSGGEPALRAPLGVEHHHCRLAILDLGQGPDGGLAVRALTDCRRRFPPVTALTNLLYVGGDGQEGMPHRSQPNSREIRLPRPLEVRVANGGVPVSGATVRFSLPEARDAPRGSIGRLEPTDSTTADVSTDADGIAECRWWPAWWLSAPDPLADFELPPHQVCEARLLDASGEELDHQIVRFHARPSYADGVAYDPSDCPDLQRAGVRTVQQAIDRLCRRAGPDSPRIVDISWPHAGEMGFDELLQRGLVVRFDRPMRPPEGPPMGWFIVTLEYDRRAFEADFHEIFVRRLNPVEIGFDDEQIAFFTSDGVAEWLREPPRAPDEVLCRVVLKSHVILDVEGNPLDGDFLRAELPTGNGAPGGDFESWFTLMLPR